LTNNLVRYETRNFYFDGHGSPTQIGDEDSKSKIGIMSADVTGILDNWCYTSGPICKHPYRFVFLDACETATYDHWHRAFGIPFRRITNEQLLTNPGGAQAFVGWDGSPRCPVLVDEWYDRMESDLIFNVAWMHGVSLDGCINLASDPKLNWPLGCQFPPVPAYFWGWANDFRIAAFGYTGITRIGFENGHTFSPYYY
jgi:hypothetical protein